MTDHEIDIPVHEAATLFPLMKGAEFDELVSDIKERGLREPLLFTVDGRLLDGRNRYRACREAGVRLTDADKETYDGPSPWAEVASRNLHRRHLNASQRGMIAEQMAQRSMEQTLAQNAAKPQVTPASSKELADQRDDLPPTMDEAAQLMNVSTATIKRARTVKRKGTPALRSAVADDRVSLHQAEKVARLAPDAQDEYVTALDDQQPPAVDGKPQPTDRRRPITDSANDALQGIWQRTEKLRRITQDDRFDRNRVPLQKHCDPLLEYIRNDLQKFTDLLHPEES